MRRLHKGLLIGGVTLAVLVPAGLVAADQMDMGNGNGNGRGNGSMTHDCNNDQTGDRIQARDGTGANHAARSGNGAGNGGGAQNQSGPMDGTGNQVRSGG
jgi:hypothetical protein